MRTIGEHPALFNWRRERKPRPRNVAAASVEILPNSHTKYSRSRIRQFGIHAQLELAARQVARARNMSALKGPISSVSPVNSRSSASRHTESRV